LIWLYITKDIFQYPKNPISCDGWSSHNKH